MTTILIQKAKAAGFTDLQLAFLAENFAALPHIHDSTDILVNDEGMTLDEALGELAEGAEEEGESDEGEVEEVDETIG